MVSVKGSRFNVDLKFRILMPLAVTLVASVLGPSVVRAQSWTALNHQPCSPGQPCFFPGTALLLTDGTVMAQDNGGSNWYRLMPDNTGSYVPEPGLKQHRCRLAMVHSISLPPCCLMAGLSSKAA